MPIIRNSLSASHFPSLFSHRPDANMAVLSTVKYSVSHYSSHTPTAEVFLGLLYNVPHYCRFTVVVKDNIAAIYHRLIHCVRVLKTGTFYR